MYGLPDDDPSLINESERATADWTLCPFSVLLLFRAPDDLHLLNALDLLVC